MWERARQRISAEWMTNEMFKTNVPYLLDQPFEFSILKTKETQNCRITEHQKNRTDVVQIIHNHVTREEHVFVQFSGSINEGSIVWFVTCCWKSQLPQKLNLFTVHLSRFKYYKLIGEYQNYGNVQKTRCKIVHRLYIVP